jgi:hypothetical protein
MEFTKFEGMEFVSWVIVVKIFEIHAIKPAQPSPVAIHKNRDCPGAWR